MRCEASNVWVGDHYEYCKREGMKGPDGRVFCRWHRGAATRRWKDAAAWKAKRDADEAAAEAIEARCEALAARLGTRVDPMYLELRGSGVRGYSDVSALVPFRWLEQLGEGRRRGWLLPAAERGELVLPPVE